MNEKEFDELKTRIADAAARHDIEWECERRKIGSEWWYDINDVDEHGRQRVDDAVAYLLVRRLIVERNGLVMFVDSPKVVPPDFNPDHEPDISLVKP